LRDSPFIVFTRFRSPASLFGMATKEASHRPEPAYWPSFLRGGDASEILARLSEGDPLRLQEASARRLREVWYLLEPERVYHRALAVCAKAASKEEPPADLGAWARAQVDLAIEQLVRKDQEAEQAHPELVAEEEKVFPLLTDSLMLDPELVRSASVTFNALDPLPRRAFFELLIEGRDVGEVIEAGPWDEDGLYNAIQTALATMRLDVPPSPPDDPEQGKQR
jgi:hypothetical protein